MAKKFLLDTNVLVEHLKGNKVVSKFLEELENEGDLNFSVLSQAEVYAGMRKWEVNATKLLFKNLKAYEVTQESAEQGGTYRKIYKNSHGTGLIDGLIAATAKIHKLTLVTFNVRHFPMIPKKLLFSPPPSKLAKSKK